MKLIKYLIYTIALLLSVLVLVYLFRNPIITKIAEKQLSIANGAMVEIEGLDNKIFSLDLNIERINVTNKSDVMEDIVVLNNLKFSLELKPLLAQKLLVNDMSIERVEFDKSRETSGELPKDWIKVEKVEEKKENKLVGEVKGYVTDRVEEEKEKIKLINLEGKDSEDKLNEILDALDYQLQGEYEKNRKELEERVSYWKEKIENNNYKEELESLEEDVKGIDYDFDRVKEIRSLDDLKKEQDLAEAKVEEVKDIIARAKEVVKEIERDKEELEAEIENLDRIKEDFIDAAKADYEKTLAIVTLDSEALLQLSLSLLGENVTAYLIYGLEQYEKITANMAKEEKVEEVKEEKMPHLPKLWIKRINLGVASSKGIYQGSILDFSSNQDRSNKPIVVELAMGQVAGIDISYDTRQGREKSTMEFFYNEVEVTNKYLESEKGRLNGLVALGSGSLKGRLDLVLDQFTIDTAEVFNKEKYAEILDDAIEGVEEIDVAIDFAFGNGNNSFSIKSNLDEDLYEGINSLLKREFEKLKVEVEKKAMEKVEKYKKELIGEISKEVDKLGVEFGREEVEALNKVKSLEELEEFAKNYVDTLEEQYKQILIEKFNEEKKVVIDKLREETANLGIELKEEHYEALNEAQNLEELEHIADKILEDLEEEKKAELEAKLREELEEEKEKLEEKAKDELKELGDKLFDKFDF